MTHQRPKLIPLPPPTFRRNDVKLRLVAVEGRTSKTTGTDFVTLTLRLTGTDHVVFRLLSLKHQARWVHTESHAALTSPNHKMPSSYGLAGCVEHFNLFIGRTCYGDLRFSDRFTHWDVIHLHPKPRET